LRTNPAAYEDMLRQWASHGFVVYSEVSSSSGDCMVDALDWLEDENVRSSSPLYQDLDLSEVAFGGHSRGSIGTFDVADEEFRRTENFLRSDCAFCNLGEVA
jgi:hypothetical protein